MFCDPQFYPLLPADELLNTATRRTILHARLAQIAPDVALLQEVEKDELAHVLNGTPLLFL